MIYARPPEPRPRSCSGGWQGFCLETGMIDFLAQMGGEGIAGALAVLDFAVILLFVAVVCRNARLIEAGRGGEPNAWGRPGRISRR